MLDSPWRGARASAPRANDHAAGRSAGVDCSGGGTRPLDESNAAMPRKGQAPAALLVRQITRAISLLAIFGALWERCCHLIVGKCCKRT